MFKKFRLFILTLVLMPMIQAETDSREALIQLLESVETLSAGFEQRTYQETSPKAAVSEGQFYLSKPNKFRWSVYQPYEQQVIADGELLWVYDPDLEQATYQPLNDNLRQSPAMILTQPRATLTDAYQVVQADVDGQQVFRMTPNDDQAVFTELQMRFTDNRINELRILDSLGQETRVEFLDVEINIDLDPAQFVFSPPPGTDLFEQM